MVLPDTAAGDELQMDLRSRFLVTMLLLMTIVPVSLTAAINPKVRVLPSASTPVPPECAEGTPATVPPRPQLREMVQPPSSSIEAPPRVDLQTALRRAQAAAERGDRAEFHERLEALDRAVASYPRGGEAGAASGVIDVYRDLERLWAYSFSADAGAFFDSSSEGGAILRMMQKYPDWSRTIGTQTLVDRSGTTLFPSAESRRFLVAEAARRLTRLGVGSNRAQEPLPGTVRPSSSLVFGDRPGTSQRPATSGRREPAVHNDTKVAAGGTSSTSRHHETSRTHETGRTHETARTHETSAETTRKTTRESTQGSTHGSTPKSGAMSMSAQSHPRSANSSGSGTATSHATAAAKPVQVASATPSRVTRTSTPSRTTTTAAAKPVTTPVPPISATVTTKPAAPRVAQTSPPATHTAATPVTQTSAQPTSAATQSVTQTTAVPPASAMAETASTTNPPVNTSSNTSSNAPASTSTTTASTTSDHVTSTVPSDTTASGTSTATSTDDAEAAPTPGADRTRIIIAAVMIAIGLAIAVALIRASK